MKRLAILLALAATLAPLGAVAEEGMWTYDNFPSQAVAQKYGFKPTQDWLDHVRLSSVRLAGGCSGSFVSPSALVMTNHHCASDCIQQLSTAKRDFIVSGFLARTAPEEQKCPDIELNTLTNIEDVTARVTKAVAGLSGKDFNDAKKAEISRIEQSCGADTKIRCDVVTLYQGGRYNLYRYKRYQDVRLVFAPEFPIAFFGGDPDNFNFPRYDLDVSFLRAYENGKPAQVKDYLKWNAQGASENELVFVSGNPGSTQRLLTISQLEFLRDVSIPTRLKLYAELRGIYTQFGKQGLEQKRISQEPLFGIENSFKALNGEEEALLDKSFFAQKVAEEQALVTQMINDPAKLALYGNAWGEIAKAQVAYKQIYKPYFFIERRNGFSSELFKIARNLVRGGEERGKPNGKRLSEFTEASLPRLTQQLFSSAPIYKELEEVDLTFALTKLRENLGVDHPDVLKVLGKDSPETLAKKVIAGSKLFDIAYRKKLWEGGNQAVLASQDPMIKLALLVDPEARALRKQYEDTVEAPEKKNGALIAKLLFAIKGTSTYPDATFSLRLSYGTVKGYQENGQMVKPFTTMGGAFDRATGQDPFALPASWLAAKNRLDLSTPFNFVSTTDIIGGNSGSPVINSKGEAVGLIFDGNIQSLGGAFGFDPRVNRSVAVTTNALTEALGKIYRADRIVKELQGN
ncbi:MAG: S46 family peptidase [Anaerolineae bacterium]|nr:S46 family peptidase [Gloeobacterales cyanobacterium ES-bin-313]